MPTIRPERAVASLAILTDGGGWLSMGDGEKAPVRKSATAKSFRDECERVWVRTLRPEGGLPEFVGKERPIEKRVVRSFLPCPDKRQARLPRLPRKQPPSPSLHPLVEDPNPQSQLPS